MAVSTSNRQMIQVNFLSFMTHGSEQYACHLFFIVQFCNERYNCTTDDREQFTNSLAFEMPFTENQ